MPEQNKVPSVLNDRGYRQEINNDICYDIHQNKSYFCFAKAIELTFLNVDGPLQQLISTFSMVVSCWDQYPHQSCRRYICSSNTEYAAATLHQDFAVAYRINFHQFRVNNVEAWLPVPNAPPKSICDMLSG